MTSHRSLLSTVARRSPSFKNPGSAADSLPMTPNPAVRVAARVAVALLALVAGLLFQTGSADAVGTLTINGAWDDERVIIEQHWGQIVDLFADQDECLVDLEVNVVDRAEDYAQREGSITAFYTTPGTIYIEHGVIFNGRTMLHEMAHHVDTRCRFRYTDEADAFRAAQGLPLDTSWYSGSSWYETPAEVFSEAVVSLFGVTPRMDIAAESRDIITAWAGGGAAKADAEQVEETPAIDEPVLVRTEAPAVLVDGFGRWWRYGDSDSAPRPFYFGNPGDYPFMGDWDCDGIETPGLYRQSDGFVYLRNTNTQGVADWEFFFGNPGDVPIVGDFDGDGCDTVSIWRPAEARIYIINRLGADGGGLGAADYFYSFGETGDIPFVGDFDGDGVDTVGLHRRTTGYVFFRNSNSSGIADAGFTFGDPGDSVIVGDWDGDGDDTIGLYRPSNGSVHLNFENTSGVADVSMETLNPWFLAAS